MTQSLDVKYLGKRDYAETLALQLELVDARKHDKINDALLLVEHPPVFTTGRATTEESLPQDLKIPIVPVSRGGDVTYHGPGQLVGYWIRKLEGQERDLHRHLRLIETKLIEILATFNLKSERREGLTGVWIDDQKIASIGVAVKSWITFHGFALNVAVDPSIYDRFRPCGLAGAVMTDLNQIRGTETEMVDLIATVEQVFLKS